MKIIEGDDNSIKHKNKHEYREAYKIAAILDLVLGTKSDAYIARKYGFSSGFMLGLKKESLERLFSYLRRDEKEG